MAKNRVFDKAHVLNLTPTDPAAGSVNSGDPCIVGTIPGVALTASHSDNSVSVQLDGVFQLSVKGIDGGGNAAVAAGDQLYYVSADTPKISKKNSGVAFGKALGTVSSGATATIDVMIGSNG